MTEFWVRLMSSKVYGRILGTIDEF